MTSIELSGVSKRYRGVRALDRVDLSIGSGVTGILGPNGAGKTTLLRVAATAIAPDKGDVSLLGRDPSRSHEDLVAIRRQLGYLPQELTFPTDMTAFGFLEYIAVLKEWNEREARHVEVRRALSVVGLENQATRKVRKLSGGQRRRVALAQALLGSPRLIVLDEPTAGLDPEQRASLRATLSGLGRNSVVLIATHQTDDVAALCERVVVLSDGAVRFDGPVVELVRSAQNCVWLCDEPVATGVASWRTGSGRVRVVGGSRPPDGEPTEPTLEDAYLLMRGAPSVPQDLS